MVNLIKNKKGVIEFYATLIFIGLFLIGLVSIIIILGENYGYSSTDIIDNRINVSFTQIKSNITNEQENANIYKNNTLSDKLTEGGSEIVFTGFWGTLKSIWGIITGIILSLFYFASILFISPIVIYGITSILIVAIIFAMWRVWRAGQ